MKQGWGVAWVLVGLSACGAVAPRAPEPAVQASAQHASAAQALGDQGQTAAQACVSQGGDWKRLGLLGLWQCERPWPDAGRVCRDSSDCQGECLAPAGSAIDQAVSGQCSAVTPLFGCHARVTAGRAEPTLCVD